MGGGGEISTFIMAFPTFSPKAFRKGMACIPMMETEWALSVSAAATSMPGSGDTQNTFCYQATTRQVLWYFLGLVQVFNLVKA